MPANPERDPHWDYINDLLRQLLAIYRDAHGAEYPPCDLQLAQHLEQALFKELDPYVKRMAASAAGSWDWPPSVGDARDIIADEISQRCNVALLSAIRGRGLPKRRMEKAYLWRIFKSMRKECWTKLERGLESLNQVWEDAEGEMTFEPAAPEPPLDDAPEYDEVPPEMRERLQGLFCRLADQPVDQVILRRKLIILLHCPFLAHGGNREPDDLVIAFGELARLLNVDNARVSNDRQELARQLQVSSPDERIEWFKATRIGTRLDFCPDCAQFLLSPRESHIRHRDLVETLWLLTRLAQVDGLTERRYLSTCQGTEPDFWWQAGACELRISIELFSLNDAPLWVGDRVRVSQVRLMPVDTELSHGRV